MRPRVDQPGAVAPASRLCFDGIAGPFRVCLYEADGRHPLTVGVLEGQRFPTVRDALFTANPVAEAAARNAGRAVVIRVLDDRGSVKVNLLKTG